MALTTGEITFGIFTSNNSGEPSEAAWTSPEQAASSNNIYATASGIIAGLTTSEMLKCQNTSTKIPANAIPKGIIIRVHCKANDQV